MTNPVSETKTKTGRTITLDFKPNTAQDEFIHSTDQQTAFVASVAAGKTVALCIRSWALSYKYPGNRGLLARYAYGDLRDTVIQTWKRWIPPELMLNPECLDRSDLAQQVLLVKSVDPHRPSEILFRNLDDPNKYKSLELGWFSISQADDPKITYGMWLTLLERLRWQVAYHYANLEANFGGNASRGGWIWDVFQDKKQGHLVTADTMVNWDNLSDDYRATLANLPKFRQHGSVYGSWDPLEYVHGMPCFPEFKFGFHTPEDGKAGDVRALFALDRPSDRPVIRGIDIPGPPACVWVQMDEKGRLLVGHELVVDQAIGVSEFADIVQNESATFFPGAKYLDYVDPAAFRTEQTSGKSNAQILFEKGLKPRPSGTHIDRRLQTVKDWLTMAVRGDAGLLIDPSCYRLIGAMQGGYHFRQIGANRRYSAIPSKNEFCVPLTSEALTPEGWKSADTLRRGDPIYVWDEPDGMTVGDVKAVNVFAGSHECIRFANDRTIEFVSTPNHRNVITTKHNVSRIVTTESLKQGHQLFHPTAETRPSKQHPFSDWFISVAAWVMAEGAYRPNDEAIVLHQSRTANPEYTAYLVQLLSGHPCVVQHRERDGGRTTSDVQTWRITKELAHSLRTWMPDKIPSPAFAARMSNRNRRRFLYEFYRGDGCFSNGTGRFKAPDPGRMGRAREIFPTKNALRAFQAKRDAVDALQMIATLAGVPSNIHEKTDGYSITLLQRSRFADIQALQPSRVDIAGVWCPTTSHGTWICRQRGRVFVTGNSHIADSLQYACHGVTRLQYSRREDDPAPPQPTAILGSMYPFRPSAPRRDEVESRPWEEHTYKTFEPRRRVRDMSRVARPPVNW